MRSLACLLIFSLFLSACSKKKHSNVDPNTGLSDNDYQEVLSINQSRAHFDEAVRYASGEKSGRVSEKAMRIAEKIQDGGCSISGNQNLPKMGNQGWSASFQVTGRSCPFDFQVLWDYSTSSQKRSLKLRESFVSQNQDFSTLSGIRSLVIDGAEWTVERSGSRQTVEGVIPYSSFVVEGLGTVKAVLSTSQSFVDRIGGGKIVFDMKVTGKFGVKVEIQMQSGHTDVYKINGHVVERDVFDALFSSFEIAQFRATTTEMLY